VSTFRKVTPRLPVADLQRTMTFYRERLDFRVDVCWPASTPTFAILIRGEVAVGFFEPSEHQPSLIGYAEIYIDVTDALGLAASLKSLVPIEWGPEVYSYGRREFAIRDPDGYLLIFTQQTDDLSTSDGEPM
jgi:hypothetical protein